MMTRASRYYAGDTASKIPVFYYRTRRPEVDCSQPAPEPDSPLLPSGPSAPKAQASTDQGTLLVIEDEEMERRLLRRALAPRGYAILEACAAGPAIELARAHPGPIDLVITDLDLPDLKGREAFERIRACHPEARVLFISGYDQAGAVENELLPPGAPFLPKPFPAEALIEAVRTGVQRRP